jgi:3-deoxy-D-manno-octulosonic-acid transferase
LRLIYNFITSFYFLGIRLSAFFGNHKAKKWVLGRINWEENLKAKLKEINAKRVWFHCASLGEFEQGRTLIEQVKKNNPTTFIVLTFFSPSGYEVRKNYQYADYICYLPSDTKKNANKFISLVSPDFIFLIKYEYWFHFINEAFLKGIPLYVASAIFPPGQIFFKWYGGFHRNMLRKIKFFFVQNEVSTSLLYKIGISQYKLTGDTRFDRVNEIANQSKENDNLKKFSEGNKVIIGGSTWSPDEEILFQVLKNLPGIVKLIIAPHEVDANRIDEIKKAALNYFTPDEIQLYSSFHESKSKILVIDNIGLLSSAYRYASIAWIGGGFGKGIHNILEAAAFGKPTLFGPNNKKFKEAVDLIELGGSFSIKNSEEAQNVISKLLHDEVYLNECSARSMNYVNSNVGATENILKNIIPFTNETKKSTDPDSYRDYREV